jgi:hypothetical protein
MVNKKLTDATAFCASLGWHRCRNVLCRSARLAEQRNQLFFAQGAYGSERIAGGGTWNGPRGGRGGALLLLRRRANVGRSVDDIVRCSISGGNRNGLRWRLKQVVWIFLRTHGRFRRVILRREQNLARRLFA